MSLRSKTAVGKALLSPASFRRNTAKVAQQFIAGLRLKKTPSRRDDSLIATSNMAGAKRYSIVPGGTHVFKNANPALKCWATFIAFETVP